MFTDIVGKIEGMLKRRGTNVAVRFDGIEYTYEELDFLSSRIASFRGGIPTMLRQGRISIIY